MEDRGGKTPPPAAPCLQPTAAVDARDAESIHSGASAPIARGRAHLRLQGPLPLELHFAPPTVCFFERFEPRTALSIARRWGTPLAIATWLGRGTPAPMLRCTALSRRCRTRANAGDVPGGPRCRGHSKVRAGAPWTSATRLERNRREVLSSSSRP